MCAEREGREGDQCKTRPEVELRGLWDHSWKGGREREILFSCYFLRERTSKDGGEKTAKSRAAAETTRKRERKEV